MAIHRTHTTTRSRPDEKMGTRRDITLRKTRAWDKWHGLFYPFHMKLSSAQRQVEKKAAAKKRRQRDKVKW